MLDMMYCVHTIVTLKQVFPRKVF